MARLGVLLVAACVIAAAALVYLRLDEPIRAVEVSGRLDAAERAQVRDVIERVDGGLLSLDVERLKRSLEALSWPRLVTVRRVWPDTLVIEIEKAYAVAAWEDAYLGSDGRVVEMASPIEDLPVLDCAVSSPRKAMEVFHRLQRVLRAEQLTISRLAENRLGEWELTLAGETTVMLGKSQVADRLAGFIALYRNRLVDDFDRVAHVDTRYVKGAAVAWREDSPEAGEDLAALVDEQNEAWRNGRR